MSARIQFTVLGSSPIQHHLFTEEQECVVGRSVDCGITLPATIEYCDVSRRHCALRIDPPFVHVRDLGSLNGTFINGARIGGRSPEGSTLDVHDEPEWFPLRDGDHLRLGRQTFLRLDIREFVADEADERSGRGRDSIGSGTFIAFPD